MPAGFRIVSRIIFGAVAVLYPALVFYFLVIRKTPIRSVSLFVMAVALCLFIAGTANSGAAALGPSKKKA